MSKETAHQLGTPLSSMLAWIELLRLSEVNHEAVDELEKDVMRLEIITERFSKIGSTPQLETINLVEVIYQVITYLKVRTSKKIEYSINLPPEATVMVSLNRHLFEWVIENLTRNAVDAMSGIGTFHIDITENEGKVMIDFTDSGKGIPRRKFKTVFQPGYSTKLRGWGLGLTLARRIIRSYHKGKIFVKSSTIDKGTTFRIVLNK
jgi:signal transduction histidine kinase